MGTVRYTVINGEVVAEKRAGVRRLYVPDPLGSTVALLDNTQAKTDTFDYWPYGEESARTGTTPTPFRFVGKLRYFRDSSSRTHIKARSLRTDRGRWLTQDPSGFKGGELNRYRYVEDRPTILTDSSGLGCDPNPPKVPCPPEVNAARRAVCKMLRSMDADQLGQLGGCLTGPVQAKCLQDFCNMNTPVFCVPASYSACVGACAFSFGGGYPGGGQDPNCPVFICWPTAGSSACFKGGTCKQLAVSILHEIIGNCGSQHFGSPPPLTDPCDRRALCLCAALGL